ncbi:MAG: hypothetical protein SGPRY_003005, partial [Prymnesium sp.]
MRTTPKMVQAFRRGEWLAVLTSRHLVFDEWSTNHATFMDVLQDMLLTGQVMARPTRHLLVQDAVIVAGTIYPTIDLYAPNAVISWQRGTLIAERRGQCICSKDVVPQFGITDCPECMRSNATGRKRPLPVTHRRFEAFAFHFQVSLPERELCSLTNIDPQGLHAQEWKKRWRKMSYVQL